MTKGKTNSLSRKPKRNWSKKEPEVFSYRNAKNEVLWGYRHRYYDSLGDRREKSKQGLASEKTAIRKLLEIKTALVNGHTKQVDNSNLTVTEWFDIWLNAYQNDWEISTREHRKQVIEDHIKPLLGKDKLFTLDRTKYRRKFINPLLKKYSPGSVNLYHTLFKIAINAAVDDEILPRNRFSRITIANESQFENFLAPDELRKLLVYAKETEAIGIYTTLLILAFTGMRRGELMGLRWSNLDFERSTITIESTRDFYGVRKPKTKNSNRTILVDDVIMQQLKSYRIWCKKTMLTFGKIWSETDFVFISDRGATPISEKFVSEPLKRIIKRAGLKEITPHGLRHTHATILLSKGIPLQTVADKLGNTPEMVLRVYGHTLKELEKESVKVFSDAIDL